jgi:hypothetical protein
VNGSARRHRSGTILIIVAGVAALLASLALAFLARQRATAEETARFSADTQARLMLVAACSYVCEASRLGYDTAPPGDANHLEAFGWVDVRDGSPGPNTRGAAAHQVVPLHDEARQSEKWAPGGPSRPAWPALKSVARCPMHVLAMPPYAIKPVAAPNAIVSDSGNPRFGMPLLSNPDPLPRAGTRAEFIAGKWDVRPSSAGRAWFRVYRDGPATFVVTCGSGGTQGFRDWDEVLAAGADAGFVGGRDFFTNLLNQEARLWYRIEWSAAVGTSEVHNIKNAWNYGPEDHYVSYGMNYSDSQVNPRSQSHARNYGGTIRFVERLRQAPTWW